MAIRVQVKMKVEVELTGASIASVISVPGSLSRLFSGPTERLASACSWILYANDVCLYECPMPKNSLFWPLTI